MPGMPVYERYPAERCFVRNHDRLYVIFAAPRVARSYMAAAECELRYIGHDVGPGPASYSPEESLNFNCSAVTHAADCTPCHIVVVTSRARRSPGN